MQPIYSIPPYKLHEVGTAQALAENYSWGMTDLRIPNVWKKSKGKGIKVAILDSGCSKHPDLFSNINYSESKSFIPNENIYDTYVGHGTHVAGIVGASHNEDGVVGVAPEVTIITVKVLSKNGISVGNSIELGLDYCLKIKPDVVNMSLGGPMAMPIIHEQIKKLTDMGIPVICAAGNDGTDNVLYPAQYEEAIAVGSYAPSALRSRSLFSSYGETLDIMAPGEEILSTYLNDQYAVMSGTSMAAPFITGVVALMLSHYRNSNKKLTNAEIKNLLMTQCIDIGDVGKDKHTGWGIVNPEHIFSQSTDNPIKVPIIPPKKTLWQKIKAWFGK